MKAPRSLGLIETTRALLPWSHLMWCSHEATTASGQTISVRLKGPVGFISRLRLSRKSAVTVLPRPISSPISRDVILGLDSFSIASAWKLRGSSSVTGITSCSCYVGRLRSLSVILGALEERLLLLLAYFETDIVADLS